MRTTIKLHPPGFSTDAWEGTDATAVELVAPPGAHNLKVKCLIKLAQVLRREAQAKGDLSLRRNYPAECSQSAQVRQEYEALVTPDDTGNTEHEVQVTPDDTGNTQHEA